MKGPDLKLFSCPPLGTQAPAPVKVLPRSCTRDRTRSPREAGRSPAAWGPVRTPPASSSGSEPVNLRREGNGCDRRTEKRRNHCGRKRICIPKLVKLYFERKPGTERHTDNKALNPFSKKKCFLPAGVML